MNPVVAVIAPGMMGAAVGKRLVDHGLKVLTSLKGRSAETVERAKAAGMVSASDEEIAATDFILSILPPGDAPEELPSLPPRFFHRQRTICADSVTALAPMDPVAEGE